MSPLSDSLYFSPLPAQRARGLEVPPRLQERKLTPLAAPFGAWGTPILPSPVPSLPGLPLHVYVGQLIRLMESWLPLARGANSPLLEPIMVNPLFPAQPFLSPRGRGGVNISHLPKGGQVSICRNTHHRDLISVFVCWTFPFKHLS